MQQWYQCPRCGAQVAFGTRFCGNCQTPLNWPTQQQPPPQYQPPPQQQYQQPQYQQQAPPNYQQSSSICVNCQHQNYHGVDHNGEATVRCQSCSIVYNVKTYQVRAKGGRRDRASGIKSYSIRVKEPDRDETLLEFASTQEIEMRAGDWIIGSYSEGKLKYLLNQQIRQYWDVQYGIEPPKKKKTNVWLIGCLGLIVLAVIIGGIVLATGSGTPVVTPTLSSDTEFQIKVSGTAGLPFSGSYMVVSSGGQSVSKSVDGTVPTQYSVEGMMVSVAFQKQTEDGTLKVEILRDGQVVKSSDTTAAYGLVSVATD
jgi:hypothetical protein